MRVNLLDDHLVLHAVHVGQALDLFAVIPGDAGVGADRDRSRGAARHHGRFGSHQGGQTIPDRFLKFLQDDILAGRFRLRLEKLGPLLGSSNRCNRPLKA